MDSSDEKIEWAYLDGELSTAEAANFDRSLSEEERERLTAEMQVENLLTERLSQRITCPNDVWLRSIAQIAKPQRVRRIRFWRRLAYGVLPLTAAAVLVILFALPWGKPNNSPIPRFLLLPEGDVSALATHTQVSEALSDVRDFLNQRAVQVSFDPSNLLDSKEAPYMLLGACESQFEGESLVELLFSCGEHPAKVVIVRQAGPAADEVGKAIAQGRIRASRPVGNVLIAVVGEHAPADLLSVIADPWVAIQPAESQDKAAPQEPDTPPDTEPPQLETAPETQQQGADIATPPAPPKYFRVTPNDRPVSFT